MKPLLKNLFCSFYKYSGVMRVQETVARLTGQPFLVILLFHRVTDEIPEDPLTIGTGRFRKLCRMLQRSFHVVSLAEAFRLVQCGQRLPSRTLAITFDDCYRDNYFAAQVLAQHGLPACFFLPTSYVGTGRTFDWDRGLSPLANLTWDDVREMARLGHDIGSHTVTHANMAQISCAQARTELYDSKAILEDQVGRAVRWFAYPFGGRRHLRPEHLPLVEEAGYEGCLSGYGGFVYPGADPRLLPREAVPYFRSNLHLELHLTGCLHWIYALKRRLGIAEKPRGQSPEVQYDRQAGDPGIVCPSL